MLFIHWCTFRILPTKWKVVPCNSNSVLFILINGAIVCETRTLECWTVTQNHQMMQYVTNITCAAWHVNNTITAHTQAKVDSIGPVWRCWAQDHCDPLQYRGALMFHDGTRSNENSPWKAVLRWNGEFDGKCSEFTEVDDSRHCIKQSYIIVHQPNDAPPSLDTEEENEGRATWAKTNIRLVPCTTSSWNALMTKLLDTTQYRNWTRIQKMIGKRNRQYWISILCIATIVFPCSSSLKSCWMATLVQSKRYSTVSILVRQIVNVYSHPYMEQRQRQKILKNKRFTECSSWTLSNTPIRNEHHRLSLFLGKTTQSVSALIIRSWTQSRSEVLPWYRPWTIVSTRQAPLRYSQLWIQAADIGKYELCRIDTILLLHFTSVMSYSHNYDLDCKTTLGRFIEQWTFYLRKSNCSLRSFI